MRLARTCYDHIAGGLGVAIADQLLDDGAVAFDGEAGHVTDRAGPSLQRLGLDPQAAITTAPGKRPNCRPCLDWSERRMHLAGRLGAMICSHCLDNGWLLRKEGSRALKVTSKGTLALRGWMGNER